MNVIEKKVRNYVSLHQHPTQKKKLNIIEVEDEIIATTKTYFEINGYHLFFTTIKALINENVLIPMKNKKTNGRNETLPLDFWLLPKKVEGKWDKLELLKMAGTLDLSYYQKNVEYQTKEEWERIKAVYHFLQKKETRQMVSVEERSLELFGHEKFLTDEKAFPEGKHFLRRIRISLDDLSAMKFGEPFVFWLKSGTSLHDIQRVLIVENLSFFHTAVQLLEQNLLENDPQLIIYGEGKKIEHSFSFFFKLFAENAYAFYYVGDIDPEGYSIYARLCRKFPNQTISLARSIYQKMFHYEQKANTYTNQVANKQDFAFFLEELKDESLKVQAQKLWEEKKRIPQEVLTIENWEEF